MDEETMLKFWGKAQAEKGGYHPAAYHCLDVAAVAQELIKQQGYAYHYLAHKVNMRPDELSSLIVFLVALHDLGKFSRAFQTLVPELCPPQWQNLNLSHSPHWQLSYVMMMTEGAIQERLQEILGVCRTTGLKPLLKAVSGHHGKPPKEGQDVKKEDISGEGESAALFFIEEIAPLFTPPTKLKLKEKQAKPLSHWLAGVTVAADWIGSNTDYFAYHKPTLCLQDYWKNIAQPQAQQAVQATGMKPAKINQNITLKSLFDIPEALRPMQQAIVDLELPKEPSLTIIEDATGSGKTEAATFLALRLMRMGLADGLYFALPTMATANGMFARMKKDYLGLFVDGETPSLALAHGMRDFHEGFAEIKLPQKSRAFMRDEDVETSAQCAGWIADDRRKTFFAQVGVGTIDQALLSVLPSKFQSLRLWGLAGRILIVDEAHAYDAYMSEELERLLEFQAALGGSAIILSATLPAHKRESLVKAYEKGLGLDPEESFEADPETEYPLVTIVNSSEAWELEKIEMARHCMRTVHVDQISETTKIVDEICAAVSKGAAVAWVRNAVDDATEAVALLREKGIQDDLFHARYIMGERQNIEQDMVQLFGKKGDPERRKGRVLVATQVIEQSLDLDFDLMVSDLAPIDLLIQRAGRLWRHMDERPEKQRPIAGPRLILFAPTLESVEDENWLKDLGHRGSFVYQNHALLWRTAHILKQSGGFTVPNDLRCMIEFVYDPLAHNMTPESLLGYDLEAGGAESGDRTIADISLLSLTKGYSEEGSWLDETMVSTRLGEETKKIRLARIEGESLVPFYSHDNIFRAWILSEISIRATWLKNLEIEAQWSGAIEKIKAHWPKYQQEHMLVVPVDENGLLQFAYGAGQKQLIYNENGLARKEVE